ncbi:MAG: ATP-binding cassette domain-containing protein [Bacteroidetes bacterium]|nr:ATP-binding cassette domain-containing protein [Bacteroidota bacterium]
MTLAIQVENLSKAYQIGMFGTGTLSNDLKRWYALARGKEDPFLKIGETNDRSVKGKSDVVWSLKDINFEIEQGEAVGIIGKNGAGKSTLLKILSRVTSPTTGKITGIGRVASLLEVGTGFHPELTGKDNIYLNGAILGMRKKEIKRKFDEIVDFAGVERYIDTPVKRYSSGMYVRLAFAVAAYLESEILIVDEVLAVGDAEFQKKCLGKMSEVQRGEGRTILFVSHNLIAVKALCSRAFLLNNGKLEITGDVGAVINNYLKLFTSKNKVFLSENLETSSNEFFAIESIELITVSDIEGAFYIDKEIALALYIINKSVTTEINFNIFFETPEGATIFVTCSTPQYLETGAIIATCTIPPNFLNDDTYTLSIMGVSESKSLIYIRNAMVIEGIEPPRKPGWLGKFPGFIRPELEWRIKKVMTK